MKEVSAAQIRNSVRVIRRVFFTNTRRITLNDGKRVTIGPIRPEDESLIVNFHQSLSEESVYFRYFQMMKLQTRVADESKKSAEKIYGTNEAEFGMLVSDRYQGLGLGTELLYSLIDVGPQE